MEKENVMINETVVNEAETVTDVATNDAEIVTEVATGDVEVETTFVAEAAPVKQRRQKKVKKSGLIERKWSIDRILVFILFVTYSITLLGGVFWAFLTSLKGKYEYAESAIALPKDWLFSNYADAFKELEKGGKSMFSMLMNSAWLSILPPTINLFTASMASYVMAKYKFPGRDLIWAIMIIMMVLPLYGSGAATYKLYRALGMLNSPLFLINSITGLGGSMMLIAAFKGVSKTYGEAAFIEGCGHFRVFVQIILPQVTGLLTALWITSFIGHWNDYMTAIMYLPKYVPITTGLYLYQLEMGRRMNVPVLFAGSLMVLIIPMILFIIFQDKFNEMNFGGGIKG